MINAVKRNRRCVNVILMLAIAGCAQPTASQLAMMALNAGNASEFCRISASSLSTDVFSYNNLGACYENGWGGYAKDKNLAISYYTTAARPWLDRAWKWPCVPSQRPSF